MAPMPSIPPPGPPETIVRTPGASGGSDRIMPPPGPSHLATRGIIAEPSRYIVRASRLLWVVLLAFVVGLASGLVVGVLL